MATIDGRWEPGIGDPTVVGWLTVVAYGFAAWACWRASAGRGARTRLRTTAGGARFWLLLAISMALLSINKQLDLQSLLTQVGRDIAVHEGWWDRRRAVQATFIAGVAIAGVLAVCLMGWLSWPLTRGRALALAGIGFLLVFIVTRASSFHHVDIVLKETAFGLRWNWILELSGIGLVAAGAIQELRAVGASLIRPREPPGPASAAVPRPAVAPRRRHPGDEQPVVSPGDPRNKGEAPRRSEQPLARAVPARRRPAAQGDDAPVLSPGDPRNKPGA